MEEEARRAIRDSRPGYAADSIRSLLRMAADPAATKVDLIQRLCLSRSVRPAANIGELLVTIGSLADTLSRNDVEREALAAAFRGVEVGGDGAWLRLADAWLDVIGANVGPGGGVGDADG